MADTVKALIVDEDLDSRVSTRRAAQRARLEVVAEVGFGTQAVSTALELTPEVILMAVEEPAARALDTARALAAAMPGIPMIVYSKVDQVDAVRRVMVLGARDYLVTPLQPTRLAEAINIALQGHAGDSGEVQHGRGTVITVTGAKGGVGKSVIAVNLALALRQETGKLVAILDADNEFGDVATLLDLTPASTIADLTVEPDKVDVADIRKVITAHESGLQVVAAAPDGSGWKRPEDTKAVIEALARSHDFVVVDTAGSLDQQVRSCVEAATLVLTVTSGEVSSVRDTAAAVRRLAAWQIDPDRVMIVLNRSKGGRQVPAETVREAIVHEVNWMIPYDKRLPASVQLGEPLVLHQPRSGAARSLTSLARSVTGSRHSLLAPADESPTLRGRLSGILNFRRKSNDSGVVAVESDGSGQ
jgi:pilus assembly protein CpaE